MAATLTLALDLCKQITERYCQLSSADDKTSSLQINGQQCMLVYNELLKTQTTLQTLQRELPDEETSSPDVGPATQELVQVLMTAYETFLKDCFYIKWMDSALKHNGDFKETVNGILCDLQWCRSVLCSILLKRAGQDSQTLKPEDCDRTLSVIDRYALSVAAKEDEESLKAALTDLKANHTCSGECCNGKQVSAACLPTQLLKMIDFRAQPKTAQEEYMKGLPEDDRDTLSKCLLVLLISPEDRPEGSFKGSGTYGTVFTTQWRGQTYAMKIPKPIHIESFKQEIAALAGLHHPHVMHLVCCTEVRPTECSYLMELMDMTLSNMLLAKQISGILQAVDLMLQVAEGMKYLHSLGLVHRDLKPDNILVKKVQEVDADYDSKNLTSSPLRNPVWVAKVSDFGSSKAKNESTAYSHQTLPIGTLMYMAPEVYDLEAEEEKPKRFHPMKTDVYSFGIICCMTVTGNSLPFPTRTRPGKGITTTKFKDSVREGTRPHLPADCCPARFAWLIERCWDGNPLSRPNFQEICRELRYIKGLLLTDDKSTLATSPPPQARIEGFQMEGCWGGQGGEPFTGHYAPNMSIKSIEIHYKSDQNPIIFYLNIEYEYNGYRATSTHGSVLTLAYVQRKQFSLDPDEFLIQVEGYEGITGAVTVSGMPVRAVSALTFRTNRKTHGPYGAGKEPQFTYFQSSVGKIVGFFGMCGMAIDALGVLMS